MADPTRLVEKRGLAGSLLRVGAEELPSRDHVRRVALAIGAGAALGSSTAAATGAAAGTAGSVISKAGGPVTFAVLGKWLGIGTLTGVLTVTSAAQVERMRARSVAADAPVPTVEVAAPALAPVAFVAPDVPPPPEVEAIPAPPAKPSVSPAPPAPGRAKVVEPAPAMNEETLPQAAPSRTDDGAAAELAPEIAFVDRAWQALQRRDHDRALSELATYELRFPDLRLHPEVLFLRMEAERQLGHTENAVALARQIVSVYPRSAQAARARSILSSR
jgi:hypothetical protein